jgi:hypothetical protein
MSDEQTIRREHGEMRAQLDRLESLVRTAYGAGGTVRPALENALATPDEQQLRQEVTAVANFLRDNNPNP